MSLSEQKNILTQNSRAIFYHKTPTSGKTSFMKRESGEVCSFDKLPTLSQIIDPGEEGYVDDIAVHPSTVIKDAAEILGLSQTDLEVDSEFNEKVDVAGDCLSIFLIRFTMVDPPIEKAKEIGASFVSLTEARNLSSVELELLRRAYSVIMDG